MHPAAVGFWGAFFGCSAVALLVAVLAFTRAARRIAITGSLAALVSAAYALVFLGWVPIESREILHRLQAITAMASATVLGLLLLMLLGAYRQEATLPWMRGLLAIIAIAGLAVAALLPARIALVVAIGAVAVITSGAVVVSALSAWRGERAGWLTLGALPSVTVAMAGVNWYAFHPDRTPWHVHAISATGGIIYLLFVATAMWTRYSYLLEVRRALEHGPTFDPVSRMPAYEPRAPSSELLGPASAKGCGVVVVSIANLEMLEQLHGRASYNHALFACASRLRRLAFPGVEVARLREDGFVIVTRHPGDAQQLVDQARHLHRRLSRPVVLGTSRDVQRLEASGAIWAPRVGVGVLFETADVPLEVAIAGARDVSRTAWTYPSGMAWYDDVAGTIEELPRTE